ncbi:MAG: hypothetical protein EXX96DRAFT_152118 [Benjaminiella poitrasii]|nr:MAG: hypothetical protein EXX96DRAFT_152118 [Benjaminiella poitrasii]
MNSFSALSDPNDPIDPTDVEFFKFTSLVPDARVLIQKGSFDAPNYRASVSLIACSSKFRYFITATIEGFIFSSTKVLRKTFYDAEKSSTVQFEGDKVLVSLSKPIHQLRISGDEKQILIATEGSEVLVYNVDDIKNNKTEVKPVHAFNLTDGILDLRPNPEALPELAAVLFENNCCKIINITNGDTVCELPINNISAICWSPKGKQIVCGKLDGTLQHFDTKGDSKDALPIPEAMSAGHGEETENRYVQDILWVENHYFLVMYARKRMNEEDDYINDGYIINRKPKSGTDPEYIRLAEITPIFTPEGRGNHFYMEIIRGLGKEIKHLIIIANAASSDISVVGEDENGEWTTWQLPENGLANLPLTEESAMDTFPVGLALDLSADEKLPPIDPSENDTPVEPFPIFYYMNDEGRIGAYHCYNTELARRGESYKSTIDSSSSTAPPAASAPVNTESTALSTPAASSTPMPSAFGVSTNSANNNSFADLLSGKNAAPATSAPSSRPTGFGFGAVSGGGIPSFSSLGSAPKLSGGFASLSTQNSPSAPSFGSTSFGSSSFGSLNQPATKINSPAFGSAISSNDEKKEQSTSEAKPMSSSALGASPVKTEETTTTSPAFGSAPAFGSTSTLGSGGFGALAKNTIPGAKSPSSAPAFGSTSTLGGGAFGSPAKSTAPATSTAPAFGSTSTLGSGGFGSLAKNTVPGAKAPTFGSASTLGSGTGFGKASVTSASTTTPATTSTASTTSTAAPSITVVSKTSVDTLPTAVTTPTSTTKPTVASSPLPKETTLKETTPSTTTTAPTESVENIKPTAKEGMAKEYENLYITVTKDIDRVSELFYSIFLEKKIKRDVSLC